MFSRLIVYSQSKVCLAGAFSFILSFFLLIEGIAQVTALTYNALPTDTYYDVPLENWVYQQQGNGDFSQANNCGPASVVMAVRSVTTQYAQLRPEEVRGHGHMGVKKNTTLSQISAALDYYGIHYRTITNISDLDAAITQRHNIVIALARMGKIELGSDFQYWNYESSKPNSCPVAGHCIGAARASWMPKVFSYLIWNQEHPGFDTGRYYQYEDNHWLVVKGKVWQFGPRYVTFDPDVFGEYSTGNKYWYTDQTPKGRNRRYYASDFEKAFAESGSVALEIIMPSEKLTAKTFLPEPTPKSVDNTLDLTRQQNVSDDITFLAHVNYSPGSVLLPQQVVTKSWRVKNIGQTDLEYEYGIIQVGGPSLATPGPIKLGFSILQDHEAVVSISGITPAQPGLYTTYWQFVDIDGNKFGTLLPFEFLVKDKSAPETAKATFSGSESPADNAVFTPGQAIHKTWRVKNTGTSTWGADHKLVFTGGELMGAPNEVAVPVTAPGSTADLSIDITAPAAGGSHQGNWQLRNPQGTFFGDPLWVKISVPDAGSQPPPNNTDMTLTCTNCPATVPPGQSFRPTVHVANSVQLLQSRGDMLRNTDGNRFGAYEFVAVNGVVNQNQGYDFTFYADHPITAPNTEGVYESKWRVWQNGNWVGPELTIHFEVKANAGGANHPPNAPTLTGPGDWAVYTGNGGINLQAQANGDPDGDAITQYYFEIFQSAQNANSGWISNNSWSPQGLGFNGYQWHVKVRDSRGAESDWSSQVWHFTVQTNEPQIYDFTYVQCHQPWGDPEQYCFCAHTNAGTLRLQVNSATDGSDRGAWQVINELGTINYSCDRDSDRPPTWTHLEYEAGTHLLRLYARRDGGWAAAASRDLTIALPENRRPNTPSILWPVHQNYINSRALTFHWVETLRTQSYRLRVATDAALTNLLVDQTFPHGTTQYNVTLPEAYATVYARVDADGPYGNNYGTVEFYIDETPPTAVVNALPAVTTDTKFNVNWGGTDERSGLRWYHVQVRDGNRPDSQWSDWLVNTTKTAELFAGQSGHTYYFRVRAMDKVGNWEDWPPGDGDTNTTVNPDAAPPTTWWNNAYSLKRNLIILNNDSDTMPGHFPVHIHFDGGTSPSASELYAASLTAGKGDDVRVVYNNQVELDRQVQQFTSDQIDIWFPIQAGLGGGQADNSNYQLYYGNGSAGAPPSNINNIFLPVTDSNTVLLAHFQENGGSTVTDTSGHGHNGNFIGAGWITGYLGYAGLFNGANSEVNFGNSGDFNLGAMTLEAWVLVNKQTGNYEHIFNKDTFWLRVSGSRQPQFNAFGAFAAGVCPNLEQNKWYHIAATYNGSGRARLYINGQECNTKEENHTPNHTSADFRVGNAYNWPTNNFPGYIQHVRISNIERTDFPYARIDIPPSVAAGVPIAPPVPGTADLAVLGVNTYPNPTGGFIVEALVQNQGNQATQNGFYTDLYIDHAPVGANDYTGSVRFWVNSPIAAGAQITLTTVLTDFTNLGNVAAAQSLAPGSEVTHSLSIQTDSAGLLKDANKANNILASASEVCLANADAFEPDDTAQQAGLFPIGQTQAHNFTQPSDQDWVKFTAEAGKTYQLNTSNLGVTADTYLYLYDTDSVTLLTANDDGADTLASHIDWTAPANGVYYLLVRHWNPNVAGCGTGYHLSIQQVDASTPTPTATATTTPPDNPTPTPTATPTTLSGQPTGNAIYLPGIFQNSKPTATATPMPGQLLAYASNKSGNFEIYTMRSDGSVQTNLTNQPSYEWGPNWSPDGKQIAFVSDRDGNLEIYVMNADGSNQRRLTHNTVYNAGPTWSPDGQWIAYKSFENNDYHVYLLKPDGSTQKLLTTGANSDWRMSWSPDGVRLAFSSFRNNNGEIYLINADGTGLTRLTNEPTEDNDVAWSPDGQKLAFVSKRDGNPEIYVMNTDGSNVVRLTNNPADDRIPVWSPDGQKLVFTSNRDGFDAVYLMNADGSAPMRLTDGPSASNFAVWKPK